VFIQTLGVVSERTKQKVTVTMADFAQNGIIGTLHNLRNRSTEELEAELAQYSADTPMSLVLPCLYS